MRITEKLSPIQDAIFFMISILGVIAAVYAWDQYIETQPGHYDLRVINDGTKHIINTRTGETWIFVGPSQHNTAGWLSLGRPSQLIAQRISETLTNATSRTAATKPTDATRNHPGTP